MINRALSRVKNNKKDIPQTIAFNHNCDGSKGWFEDSYQKKAPIYPEATQIFFKCSTTRRVTLKKPYIRVWPQKKTTGKGEETGHSHQGGLGCFEEHWSDWFSGAPSPAGVESAQLLICNCCHLQLYNCCCKVAVYGSWGPSDSLLRNTPVLYTIASEARVMLCFVKGQALHRRAKMAAQGLVVGRAASSSCLTSQTWGNLWFLPFASLQCLAQRI